MTNTTAATQTIGVPAAGRYRLDSERSWVTFSARHLLGLGPVSGTMVADGDLTVDPATLQASVTAAISVASLNMANRRRDGDVRSAKFLDAERYPSLTFRADTLSQAEGRWMLGGSWGYAG